MSATVPHTSKFGAVDCTNAWGGDAEALGASDLFRVLRPGFIPNPGRTYEENTEIISDVGQPEDDLSKVEPSFDFQSYMRYSGAVNRFPAVFFGTDTVSDVDEGTVNVGKKHLLTLHNTLIGKYLTVGAKWDAGIIEVPQCKVADLGVSWANGQKPVMSPSIFARRILEPGETQINGATEFGNLTLVTTGGLVLDSHVSVRWNAQGGDALDSGDVQGVTDLEISLSRNLTGEDPDSESTPYRLEPVCGDGGYSANVSVTMSDWEDFVEWQAHRDGTLYKLEIIWTGALLSGAATETFSYTFGFPQMQIIEPGIEPDNRVRQALNFKATTASSTPTGMDDNAPYCAIVNEESAAYVA